MLDGLYLRIAIMVVLLAAGCVGGCRWQKHNDATVLANKNTALMIAAADLRRAAYALAGSADHFRAIDTQTLANAAIAAAAKRDADAAAARARAEHAEAEKALQKLEALLQAERTTCVDGRKPICGLPLR